LKQAVPLSRYLVFFSVALGGCAVDLATKRWVFDYLGLPGPDSPTKWLWEGVLGFQTSLNEGALFGMGQGWWPLFAILSVVAAVGIAVWLFAFRAAHDWLLTVALAFVTAGILGNLYDRLGLPGLVWRDASFGHVPGETVHAVRDFILMMIGNWAWPTYNLADSSLVCGAVLLVCHALFTKVEEEPATMESPPSDRIKESS
jgi:signal peptidase II